MRRRILIDGRKLGDGGIGVYLDNLISGLLCRPGYELGVVGLRGKIISYPWGGDVAIFEDAAPLYSISELVLLPRRLPLKNYDLFHVPHYTLPYGIPIPRIVTVHDLIHISHPEHPYYPFVAAPLIRSAVKRADRVLAVSSSTKDSIQALLKYKQNIVNKLRVVPNALDPDFLKAARAPELSFPPGAVKGPYLLAVFSTIKPHKALDDLLHAFAALRRRVQGRKEVADLKLVVTGQGASKLVENEKLLDTAGSLDNVRVVGELSKKDLIAFYRAAAGVIVPSLAEGFCLPVLEAHAFGVPVIVRPVPAIMELVLPCDYVARDFSLSALEDVVFRYLKDYADRATNRTGELADFDLSRFSRESVAEQICQVYEEAIASRNIP